MLLFGRRFYVQVLRDQATKSSPILVAQRLATNLYNAVLVAIV
jgi:hypothetical protein